MKKTAKSSIADAPDRWQKREDAALIMRHAELVQDRGRYKQAMSHIKQAVKVNDKKK